MQKIKLLNGIKKGLNNRDTQQIKISILVFILVILSSQIIEYGTVFFKEFTYVSSLAFSSASDNFKVINYIVSFISMLISTLGVATITSLTFVIEKNILFLNREDIKSLSFMKKGGYIFIIFSKLLSLMGINYFKILLHLIFNNLIMNNLCQHYPDIGVAIRFLIGMYKIIKKAFINSNQLYLFSMQTIGLVVFLYIYYCVFKVYNKNYKK